jgi:hypothetical protein
VSFHETTDRTVALTLFWKGRYKKNDCPDGADDLIFHKDNVGDDSADKTCLKKRHRYRRETIKLPLEAVQLPLEAVQLPLGGS